MSHFSTEVGEEGEWPAPPERWSYSTLVEVETCPLRYALRRATYSGGMHGGVGYPDKLTEPALLGTTIHAAVEAVLRALRSSGVAGAHGAVTALRELGGYSVVVRSALDATLAAVRTNPRMEGHYERLDARLRRRIPEMRRVVQSLVSRIPEPSEGADVSAAGSNPGERGSAERPLGVGRHPEVHLRADDLRLKGQVDLLTVRAEAADIVDFKSGQPGEHHAEQVHLYGLLWLSDATANPKRLPVGSLTLAYSGHEVAVPAPADWTELHEATEARISEADASVAATPPQALLSDACSTCPVRHMCAAYWRTDASCSATAPFVDVEAIVLGRNGPKSWNARVSRTEQPALLRTMSESIEFKAGQTVRILDAVLEERSADDQEDHNVMVLTLVGGSEVWALAG